MIQQRFLRFNPILALMLFIGFIVLSYYIMVNMLVYLYYLTPFLLLGAFILNQRTVIQWVKNLLNKFKKDPILGLLNLLIQLLILPFVSLWLLFLGYFQRKLSNYQKPTFQKQEDRFTPYEIIDEAVKKEGKIDTR
jgi:hypothetical protein